MPQDKYILKPKQRKRVTDGMVKLKALIRRGNVKRTRNIFLEQSRPLR